MNQKVFWNSNMVLAHELNRTPMPTSNSDLTSFSFLVLIFLSPCDVAIPAILPCHNSAQISIFGVSYPHKRKHFLTGPHWPTSRRFNGSGNLIDRSDKTVTGANVGPTCSGGPIPRQTSARCGGVTADRNKWRRLRIVIILTILIHIRYTANTEMY